jgi:phenylacetate-CoA ligase
MQSRLRPLWSVAVPPPREVTSATPAALARARTRYVLPLFRAMAARVPAYRDFLKKHRVNADRIRTEADLLKVPALDKKNYLLRYPLEALCWDGKLLDKRLIYTSSSGSSGQAFYFPRDTSLDERSSLLFELYLKSISRGRKPSTLFIVSFGMGVWIGGLISFQSCRRLAERGYPVSVITPGSNKKEVFEALKRLAPKYDQVVLGGYPPFVKDVLDEAPEHGFDPKKSPLKLLFAAEGFSESFRDYVMERAGAADPAFDTANIYGTADVGTMAIETPVSIALRREAVADPKLFTALFSQAARLPTLAQFHPGIVDFEAVDGELFVSGGSALPLMRYAVGDRGGVMSYREAMDAAADVAPEAAAAVKRSVGRAALPLPFVYVYERTDFSAKLYGAIIYAEHVRAGLQHAALTGLVTGKFSMATKRDEKEDEYLEIDVELKPKINDTEDARRRVREVIVAVLNEKNAEYHYLSSNLKDRVLPRIVLWPYEHPEHFRPGAKQRWVKK